jgi:hypothetical protein
VSLQSRGLFSKKIFLFSFHELSHFPWTIDRGKNNVIPRRVVGRWCMFGFIYETFNTPLKGKKNVEFRGMLRRQVTCTCWFTLRFVRDLCDFCLCLDCLLFWFYCVFVCRVWMGLVACAAYRGWIENPTSD